MDPDALPTATDTLLIASVRQALKQFSPGPIVVEGSISANKLQKPKIRAQQKVKALPSITIEQKEGEMAPLVNEEVQHCAAVIVAAFLNPFTVSWDYDRFVDMAGKKDAPGKYFEEVHLGFIDTPATLVDMHGKIFMWYLPSLLLPARVEELNRMTRHLKEPLCNSVKPNKVSNWRLNHFTLDGNEAAFGIGKLSLSVGKFQLAHERLQDSIHPSPDLRIPAVRQWLKSIEPAEQLLDAVLQITHPEMRLANTRTTKSLLEQMGDPSLTWPTVYPGMDVIANRLSPMHIDKGGASSYYDHLVSFGEDHQAKLLLHNLSAEFAYHAGTSALFSGSIFTHEVPQWPGGERLVIAHYSKDSMQDRMGVARPLLPSQLDWLSKYS